MRKVERSTKEVSQVPERAKTLGFGCFTIGMFVVILLFAFISFGLISQNYWIAGGVSLIFDNDWQQVLESEFDKPYYQQLREFLKQQYTIETVYPAMDDLWSAFKETAFQDVKVVIVGQDPYHGAGQAHGMSFSVQAGVKHPPSLRNMLKELNEDLGCEVPVEGTLTKWAKQGVFLLNTVLTVRAGAAHSHKDQGWELFTDEVIRKLSQRETPIVFVLWGRPAQMKRKLIDTSRHAIIESVHPSPLSAYRGFFGSKPYSKINKQLTEWGQSPIDFCLK